MTDKPHVWFYLGVWWCGLKRNAALAWTGHTPTEALMRRHQWLTAKDNA